MKLKTMLYGIGAAVGLSLVANSIVYTVDEQEQVLITRMGDPVRTEKDAGLHVKIPWPIEVANKFDKRLLEYKDSPVRMATKDKKFLIIDNFALWRIDDAAKFYQSVHSEEGGQGALDALINPGVQQTVSRYDLIEIVRSSNRQIKRTAELGDYKLENVERGRQQLMQEVTKYSTKESHNRNYGMKIQDVRVIKTEYPKRIRTGVFERMQAERQKIAKLYISQGQEQAQGIKGKMEFEQKKILSEAEKVAKTTMGQADAENLKIRAKGLNTDPEFYDFQRSLEVYKEGLKGKSTLVLSKDAPIFKYLDGPKK